MMEDGVSEEKPVGYRNPPSHTKFKKNQSGNPLGRPRRARSYRAVIREEMSEPIKITVDGKRRTLSTFQVLIKRMKADALKGDRWARRDLFELTQVHCPELFTEEVKMDLSETQRELMRRLAERAKATEPGRIEELEKFRQLKAGKKPPE